MLRDDSRRVKFREAMAMSIDEKERERRRALLRTHYDVENEHDLDGIMKTFSEGAEMLYNRQSFRGRENIRAAHAYIGLSAVRGAFGGIRNIIDREHVTADEIVVEGRLCGKHVGEFQGFPPTQRDVELPFVAFYRFDEKGKLTSERVVMNLGVLRE
jgi:SnoaL-like domain